MMKMLMWKESLKNTHGLVKHESGLLHLLKADLQVCLSAMLKKFAMHKNVWLGVQGREGRGGCNLV